jgi:hypothetical protein
LMHAVLLPPWLGVPGVLVPMVSLQAYRRVVRCLLFHHVLNHATSRWHDVLLLRHRLPHN